jgi:hypothetical protein
MQGEMKAEWKKSKCYLYSATSSHPNKAMLTVFSLVAEYFHEPPRTLYACYILLSILNLNIEYLSYLMHTYAGFYREN